MNKAGAAVCPIGNPKKAACTIGKDDGKTIILHPDISS
jgi:hypothetical protein